MIIKKRIKLTLLLLVIASINSIAQATLGDWMQDAGVRGMAYASEFAKKTIKHAWSGDPRFKFVCAVAASCFIFKAGYTQMLMKNARKKSERKKIKKEYWLTSGKYWGLPSAYSATTGSGLDYFLSAKYGEGIATTAALNRQPIGAMFGDAAHSFSPAEKVQIESVLSRMGLEPNKYIVVKQEGNNGGTLGTSNGGIIYLGSDLSKNPQEMESVLGHEAVHLKNDHAIKKALAGIFIPIGIEAGSRLLHYATTKLIQKLKRKYEIKKDSKAAAALSWLRYCTDTFANSYILKGLISFYLLHGYYRSHEKEADLESARQLKCAKGTADRYEGLAATNIKYKESSLSQDYDNQGNYLLDLDHPALTERVAYLRPLAEEQARVA